MLVDADVECLHVDIADVQRRRQELERVDVYAELVETDKSRLVVGFHDGERVDVQFVSERIEEYILDGDGPANHFFGVVLDVAAGYLWAN